MSAVGKDEAGAGQEAREAPRGFAGALQAWAGQAAALARPDPAADLVTRLWLEAQALLPTA
jgi:nitronate monooxygenase